MFDTGLLQEMVGLIQFSQYKNVGLIKFSQKNVGLIKSSRKNVGLI